MWNTEEWFAICSLSITLTKCPQTKDCKWVNCALLGGHRLLNWCANLIIVSKYKLAFLRGTWVNFMFEYWKQSGRWVSSLPASRTDAEDLSDGFTHNALFGELLTNNVDNRLWIFYCETLGFFGDSWWTCERILSSESVSRTESKTMHNECMFRFDWVMTQKRGGILGTPAVEIQLAWIMSDEVGDV